MEGWQEGIFSCSARWHFMFVSFIFQSKNSFGVISLYFTKAGNINWLNLFNCIWNSNCLGALGITLHNALKTTVIVNGMSEGNKLLPLTLL